MHAVRDQSTYPAALQAALLVGVLLVTAQTPAQHTSQTTLGQMHSFNRSPYITAQRLDVVIVQQSGSAQLPGSRQAKLSQSRPCHNKPPAAVQSTAPELTAHVKGANNRTVVVDRASETDA